MNDLHDYIQKKRDVLVQHLQTTFETKKKSALAGLQTYIDSLSHLQNFTPRGKLLRGIQVLLAYEMFADNLTDEILNAAAAVEIMQAAILIQDDVMDNDYIRRGQQSLFAYYTDKGEDQHSVNPLLYGQSMAVCVGDIGYFISFELLNKSSDDMKKIHKVLDIFTNDWQHVGAGQMMDVDIASRPYEPTEEEIMTIYIYKTARYSISQPLRIGAILAGADDATVQKLDKLGELLGIIFQIKDDELGIFGDERELGKPIGSDIRENKKTLLRSFLMKNVSTDEKKKLELIFGKKDITEEEIRTVKDYIHSHQILEELQKRVDALTHESFTIIDSLKIESDHQSLLKEFVELIIKRDK